MGVRYLLAIAFVIAVIGGLAGVKALQISKLIGFGRAAAQAGPPPEAVSTARAVAQRWEGTITAVGTIAPATGVTVASEAAGVVTAIRFNSGALVRRGQVLVTLDTDVERAQLAAARARRELARANATRSRALIKNGVIAGAQLDTDEATLKSSAADVAGLQAQIERKTVRAPFAGRLGIRLVNVGQYVAPGTPIAVLQAVDALYVDFTVPQQRLPEVQVGQAVRVAIDGAPAPVAGAVAAIDPTVDPATRAVKLRATVTGAAARLRPGMFATVAVVLPERAPQVVVPLTAVVRAAYGDSVFVVEAPEAAAPRVVRQQFVRLGEARGDFVAIQEGVTAGQEVVVAGAFKLRNGAPVVVDNRMRPDARLDPRPSNR